jgi:hypothetical protein
MHQQDGASQLSAEKTRQILTAMSTLTLSLQTKMGLKANLTNLEKELEAREIYFDCKLTLTRKVEILKEDKRRRLERQVEVKLQTRRYKWTGLKLSANIQLLKQDKEEKEEHAGGEYDIDILKYCKLVSWSIAQSIFED